MLLFPAFHFLDCAKARNGAYEPDKYCFGMDNDGEKLNPWGCRLFGMNWSEWNRDPDWLTFGRWEGSGRRLCWRFDKPHIFHQIRQGRNKVGLCPYLSKTLPEAFVAALPDTVAPFTDPNWTYREARNPMAPGVLKMTIEEEEDWPREICILGVTPKTTNLLYKILARLLNDH